MIDKLCGSALSPTPTDTMASDDGKVIPDFILCVVSSGSGPDRRARCRCPLWPRSRLPPLFCFPCLRREHCAKTPDRVFMTQPMGDGTVKDWTL